MTKITAKPLSGKSYVHEVSWLDGLGMNLRCSFMLNFNLHTPINSLPQVLMSFQFRDTVVKQEIEADFCITKLERWRLEVSHFNTFANYLETMNHKHFYNYNKTEKNFSAQGAKISYIASDWSEFAESVYKLYKNVAERHGTKLFDENFFRIVATRPDYKLICAWVNNKMVGVLVVVDESPTLHSLCCGLDYEYSKQSFAYSKLHYEFIKLAIESPFIQFADLGPTAGEVKKILNFKPISVCIDVRSNNWLLKRFLRLASPLITATIGSMSKLKFGLKMFSK